MKALIRPLIGVLLLIVALDVFAQTLQGSIGWNRRVALGFGMSGQVETVLVQPGAAVNSGEILVRLDATVYEIALRKVGNAEELYRVERDQQRADFDREQTLFDEGSLPAVQLDLEKLELARVESAYAGALLERQHAEFQLELARLKAPFSAWVIDSAFAPGQYVNHDLGDPPVITLAERGFYLARVLVNAQTAAVFSVESDVRVQVVGREFEAITSAIGLEPVPGPEQNAQYLLAVRFASDQLIRPGTACTVTLP